MSIGKLIEKIPIGTRSLLWGVHAFWFHPFEVAYGWYKLYGFPWDPRLWLCFIVHDWGYWGCHDMDKEEGTEHPILGASIVANLLGKEWGNFCVYHSGTFARYFGEQPSRLCWADKSAMFLTPKKFYRWRAYASGEIHEYMERENAQTFQGWYEIVSCNLKNLIQQHNAIS